MGERALPVSEAVKNLLVEGRGPGPGGQRRQGKEFYYAEGSGLDPPAATEGRRAIKKGQVTKAWEREQTRSIGKRECTPGCIP